MNLQELLGEELFSQVDAKITEHNNGIEDKLKHVRFADLSEGNYVSREKYQTLETKSNGLETQLGEANNTIKSYKEMDIDGIRQSGSASFSLLFPSAAAPLSSFTDLSIFSNSLV